MPGTMRPNPLSPSTIEGGQQLYTKASPVEMPGKGMPLPKAQTPPQGPDPTAGIQKSIDSDNTRLQAQFDQLKARDGTLSRVIVGMEHLVALGDTVTPEDVTEAASGFVAAGLGPKAVAGVLAQMPVDSQEALGNWCEQIFDSTIQMKEQLDKELAGIGHELATSGMRMLLLSHVQDKGQQAQAPQGDGEAEASPAPEEPPEESPAPEAGA